eukprot:g6017.t1
MSYLLVELSSFCAAKNQAECHYRRRRPPSRPPASSASRSASSPSARDPGQGNGGRSFWRTDDSYAAAAQDEEGGNNDEMTGGADRGRERGLLLRLKRGRFRASPATGLVGLQENQFLGDFFDCLGFLAITNQSTVRDAMVRIMLAGRSANCAHQGHRHSGARLPFRALPICRQGRKGFEQELGGKGLEGTRQPDSGEINTNVHGGCQSKALAAERGTRMLLPRDSSTCILWCAIALGALVRGHPLPEVGRYADLAEDSLRACHDDATLDTARAYVATAILHDFLGDRVKTHDYLEVANSIVDELPPEKISRGFHGLLQYAGMAWTLDTELASEEDVKGYWENAAPIWELSESVAEHDVSGLVLSVCVRMNQPFVDETSVKRLVVAEEPQPPPQPQPPSLVKPVTYRPSIEQEAQHDAQPVVGGSRGGPPRETVAVEDECQVGLSRIIACTQDRKSVLPEMLRVQEYFESSKMHRGIGGLLYYGNLAYLQAINDLDPAVPFMRAIDVNLRYPGLCRYKSWLWIVHSYLFLLAVTKRRCTYEKMRVSYNAVLPPGSKPAPPYEECRSMSDICDHAYCRKTVTFMTHLLKDIRPHSKPPAP